SSKLAVILNNAVVNDASIARDMRMGVRLRRAPMGCPARVAKPAVHLSRLAGALGKLAFLLQNALEPRELSFGAEDVELRSFDDRDSGRIIAPVFQLLESADDQRNWIFWPDITDDSAHGV